MSDIRLRARSVTEIVDAAFQLYKRETLDYVLVTALAYAPVVVAQMIVLRGATLTSVQALGSLSTVFVLGAVGLLALVLMSAVLIRFSSDIYLEQPTALVTVVRSVLPTVPRLIGATLLVGLVSMLGFFPIAFFFVPGSIPLAIAGVLLAIAWVFYVIARFFAVNQLIVLEKLGVVAALARSGVLSQNRKWHVLATILLVFVIFIMLQVGVTMVAQIAGSNAISLILQTLYTVVAYPLIGITQMILYYDARIRAEGFDIEVMAGAQGTPATGTT